MKTKAELKALKEEVEKLNAKLAELSEEELTQVTGGFCAALIMAGAVPRGGAIFVDGGAVFGGGETITGIEFEPNRPQSGGGICPTESHTPKS